jgi:hypothetical protein
MHILYILIKDRLRHVLLFNSKLLHEKMRQFHVGSRSQLNESIVVLPANIHPLEPFRLQELVENLFGLRDGNLGLTYLQLHSRIDQRRQRLRLVGDCSQHKLDVIGFPWKHAVQKASLADVVGEGIHNGVVLDGFVVAITVLAAIIIVVVLRLGLRAAAFVSRSRNSSSLLHGHTANLQPAVPQLRVAARDRLGQRLRSHVVLQRVRQVFPNLLRLLFRKTVFGEKTLVEELLAQCESFHDACRWCYNVCNREALRIVVISSFSSARNFFDDDGLPVPRNQYDNEGKSG